MHSKNLHIAVKKLFKGYQGLLKLSAINFSCQSNNPASHIHQIKEK